MFLISTYYRLTKPGIIYGNAITAAGGFFLASKWHGNLWLFIAMLIGLSLVIASACVFNNYIDKGIDEKMERTSKRALVRKLVPGRNAIVYASVLGFIGFFVLIFYTNLLTSFIAFVGFFFYVVMYSIWKRRSIQGTIIGSISGAVPPVVGYCAVTNHFDVGAFILFLILVLWQMPHFYAITIFRLKDYKAAGIPVLPAKKGIQSTKIHMFLYIIAFLIASIMLFVFHYTGYVYLVVAFILGLLWLGLAITGFTTANDMQWARKMFFFSLVILTLLSLMMSVDVAKI